MAPDLNSLPHSTSHPHSPNMLQASPVLSTAGISRQMPAPLASSQIIGQRNRAAMAERDAVTHDRDQLDMPVRLPRPLSAAEVYLECEKEQEAVVNRLTREISALRAATSLVAPHASSTSTLTSASLIPVDIADPNPTHQITGASHPIPFRHRSSSSLSGRSNPSSSGGSFTNLWSHGQSINAANAPATFHSQASAERAAAAGNNISRQPSVNASGSSTPARQSVDYTRPHLGQQQRPTLSRDQSRSSIHRSQPQASASQSPVDAVAQQSQMDKLVAENEALRQRIQALERMLHARRRDSNNSELGGLDMHAIRMTSPDVRPMHSPAGVSAWAAGDGGVGGVAGPRERSESQSTTASSRRGLPAEEESKLVESVGSIGVGRSG